MKIETQIKYLIKARDIISDKTKWCQGTAAMNKNGDHVDSKNRSAIKYCAYGVIWKICRTVAQDIVLGKLLDKETKRSTKNDNIVQLNDDKKTPHAHRKVIGVFNRVIKKLQKQLE